MKTAGRLLAEVGHYLTALCGKFCVSRNAEDTFTILLDEGKEEHIKGQIKKRFEQDFHVSGNSISLNEVMITLHYPRDFCSLAEYRHCMDICWKRHKIQGNRSFLRWMKP